MTKSKKKNMFYKPSIKEVEEDEELDDSDDSVVEVISEPKREPIIKLAVDFPNEWLNNIANKINEIIDRLN